MVSSSRASLAGSDEEDLDDKDDGVDLARKPWTKEVPGCALSWLPRSSPFGDTLRGPALTPVLSRAARRTASGRRTS